MDHTQLKDLIIKPTTNIFQYHSSSMVELLFLTALMETNSGEILQTKDGYGLYGMTILQHENVWHDHLRMDVRAINILTINLNIIPQHGNYERLTFDLLYASAMAFLHYYYQRKEFQSPEFELGEAETLARIYYKYFKGVEPDKSTLKRAILAYEGCENTSATETRKSKSTRGSR